MTLNFVNIAIAAIPRRARNTSSSIMNASTLSPPQASDRLSPRPHAIKGGHRLAVEASWARRAELIHTKQQGAKRMGTDDPSVLNTCPVLLSLIYFRNWKFSEVI